MRWQGRFESCADGEHLERRPRFLGGRDRGLSLRCDLAVEVLGRKFLQQKVHVVAIHVEEGCHDGGNGALQELEHRMDVGLEVPPV